MQPTRFTPRVMLIWGIALLLAGALIQVVLPNIGYSIASTMGSATGVDQAILLVFDSAGRTAGVLVTPVGTALLGAGIVMKYLRVTAA